MTRIDPSSLHPHPGRAYPLGANVRYDGIRFAVVSRHATRVWVALFDNIADLQPAVEFEFNSDR